jgi:16S rRNA (cytosine1402-N4)-methyltransferase
MKKDNPCLPAGRYHESVMTGEILENLHINKACKYIDATLGTGGHTIAIAKEGGSVLGIETDPAMLKIAGERIKEAKLENCRPVNGNFTDIDKIAKENGFTDVTGIVFDLGVSNIHLKDESRGFSFGNPEAELDMRLNRESQGVSAADLLNLLRRDQLVELFSVTLEPGAARWLSSRVLTFREKQKFEKVGDMLEVCKGLNTGKKSLNEATLPFLALRIAVNNELDNLKIALPKAYDLLEKGGRLIVITFHSREDEIVKEFFGKKGKYISPKTDEIDRNQRSRSAKMRILEKV